MRRLKFNAVLLLTVVSLVLSLRAVIAVVLLAGGWVLCIWRRWLAVVGLRILVVLIWSGPAGAVERLSTGFTSTASSKAAACNEEQEESDDNHGQNDPSYPVVPCGVPTVAISVAVITPSHSD